MSNCERHSSENTGFALAMSWALLQLGDMAQWLAKWSDLVLEPPEESRSVSDTLNPYAIVITRTGEEPPSEVLEDADSASQRDLGLSQALHCLEAAQVATEAADWSSVSESLQQLLCLLQSEGEKTQEWKGRMDGYVEQELLAGSMTQLLLRTLRTAATRQQEVDVGEFEDSGVNQAIIDSACSVLALLGQEARLAVELIRGCWQSHHSAYLVVFAIDKCVVSKLTERVMMRTASGVAASCSL
eukprot:5869735-Amphidinium_carterae.1